MSETRRQSICSSFGERVSSLRTSVSKTFRRIAFSISIPRLGRQRKVVRTRTVGTGMESGSRISLRTERMLTRSRIIPITKDMASQTQQGRRKPGRLSMSSQTRLVIEEGHYERQEEGEIQFSPTDTYSELGNLDYASRYVKKLKGVKVGVPNKRPVVLNAAKESVPLYCRETFSSSLKRRPSRSPSLSRSLNSSPSASTERFLKPGIPDTRLCSSRPRPRVKPVVIDVRPIIPGPESSLIGRTRHIELESYRRVPSSDSEDGLDQDSRSRLNVRRAATNNKRSHKRVSKMSFNPEPEPPNFITRTDSSIRIPFPIGIYIQQKRSRSPAQAQQRLENSDLRRNSN